MPPDAMRQMSWKHFLFWQLSRTFYRKYFYCVYCVTHTLSYASGQLVLNNVTREGKESDIDY